MEFITLGCGSSVGVPMLACTCEVCTGNEEKNRRTRTSALIKNGIDQQIAIDLSPDLRNQLLREGVRKLSAAIITHCHYDHIAGLDDLKPLTFHNPELIPIYARGSDIKELKSRFDYIFNPDPAYLGAPMPKVKLIEITPGISFEVLSVKIMPFEVQHGHIKSLGLRINNLAYIPDCSEVPENSMKYLKDLDYLYIDGLWKKDKTSTHFNLAKSVEFSLKIAAKQSFITHMSCDIDYISDSKDLPETINLSYDGMRVAI
jgi:phosphoribosyl 1,2-cyclic phosphate phosphodiesterase